MDAASRSRMMASIRGKDTKPELTLRRALHRRGLRYRLHWKKLPGRPDLVFPRFRAALFVHGCFWHQHEGCRFATTPATRTEFWQAKFDANVERDRRNQCDLANSGWKVGVVWECSIRKRGGEAIASEVNAWLPSDEKNFEI
ncbi:very short patch repair endonuclease [Pacificimonas aurantium]|uniref:very short patch repair endonuclease n=1 Tax=Pacificimonas aurantium TaxID=1250540 RepID=UPI001CC9DC39|nr:MULTISPECIES: very short patch repair endonuclease [Pacificimonas]